MPHANEDLLRRGYEAFARGDMETIRALFGPDILWHAPGKSPFSGDYKGVDEVLQFFARLMEESDGTFRLEIHDVLANEEHGVALVKTSAQRRGRSLSSNDAHVFHLEGGKVTEFWGHPGDQYAIDEFWS